MKVIDMGIWPRKVAVEHYVLHETRKKVSHYP